MLTRSAAADEAIAGFIAGASATLVLHPMDLVKVRLQLSKSSLGSILTTLNRSGLKAYYRGVSPNLAGSTLSWGIYFGLYAKIKELFGPKESSWKHLSASILSGSITIILINPIWVVKTRMLNDSLDYKSLSHGLRKLWSLEGIRGYYKGIIPGLFGTLHGAIQFTIYEKLKSLRKSSIQSNQLNTSDVLITSSASKVLATIITYPYQVVRSKLQVQTYQKSILEIIQECSRGLGINCIRVLPGTMITFGVYEGLIDVFKKF